MACRTGLRNRMLESDLKLMRGQWRRLHASLAFSLPSLFNAMSHRSLKQDRE